MIEDVLRKNASVLASVCAQIKSGERVLIITDTTTGDVGSYLFDAVKQLTPNVTTAYMQPTKMHGMEPPDNVATEMLGADVIMGATRFSLAHSQARLNATNKGARYLSLADYSLEQLAKPSVGVDYKKWAVYAKQVKEILDGAKHIEVTTKLGTYITMDASDRIANCCPGICYSKGMMGSPPDIETNVSPIEELSNGIVVVDGSIACKEVGVLHQPIALKVRNGSIYDIDTRSSQGKALEQLFDLKNNPKRGVLAEFGIGMNPLAELCGLMLEDEGCYGTIHFGFGSNATVGGKNKVDFHLDHLIREPYVSVNGKLLIEKGVLILDGKHIYGD